MAGAKGDRAKGKGRRHPPVAQVQPWHATSGDEDARAIYQGRLELFAKMALLISVSLLSFAVVAYEVYPEMKPKYAYIQHGIAFVGLALLILLWVVFLRSDRRTKLSTLRAMDVFFITVYGAMFGLNAFLSFDKPDNMHTMFIWDCFVIFGRVLYIPSSARRTLWVSTAAMFWMESPSRFPSRSTRPESRSSAARSCSRRSPCSSRPSARP
jgi:FtsH-binding integral membrane protein